MQISSFALAFALVVSLSSNALAGEKVGGTVSVDPTSRSAGGGLGGARNSTDTTQYIGALTQNAGTTLLAVFYARDAAGNLGLCTTTAANLVSLAQHVYSDSWISFTWDASGTCTSAAVYNKSSLEPKL